MISHRMPAGTAALPRLFAASLAVTALVSPMAAWCVSRPHLRRCGAGQAASSQLGRGHTPYHSSRAP